MSPWTCTELRYPHNTSFLYTTRGPASQETIPANIPTCSHHHAGAHSLLPSFSKLHVSRGFHLCYFCGKGLHLHWVINQPYVEDQDPKKSEGRKEKKKSVAVSMENKQTVGLFPKSMEIKPLVDLKAFSHSPHHSRPESLLAKRRISRSKGPEECILKEVKSHLCMGFPKVRSEPGGSGVKQKKKWGKA